MKYMKLYEPNSMESEKIQIIYQKSHRKVHFSLYVSMYSWVLNVPLLRFFLLCVITAIDFGISN